MKGRIRGHSQKAGLPPGTLVHIGQNYGEKPKINFLKYDEKGYQEQEVNIFDQCPVVFKNATVSWINISGIHDIQLLENCGERLGIHALVLEDILNTNQRPKFEDYGEYYFIILKRIGYQEQQHEIDMEQVSLIVGKNFVVSFQEREGDIFSPVRDRIINGKGSIRKMGADFLAYSLLDGVIDNYFIVLEVLGEEIEQLEENLMSRPTRETLRMIHKLKHEMLLLRKSIWPLREVIDSMQNEVTPMIQASTGPYLRDLYDHVIEMVDVIETYRDMLSGMLDIYLSSISNRMNEVMKVLTVISTIFIPLTFIAGVYGMNFTFMPELKWHWGYPVIMGFMLIIAILMLFFFRRKKWL
ncbi:magnesium/cobalt transporter CorA [Candidatus Formimonas warabiya]|uniref:Magnesium transport protein CorA n=1 Tax=Formimonas warabiya TaxID=1761012 RepID=A0A3G1KXB6_FORW1|nr:magnesium/cobalt transporter CorA [Candidatus Formimonas warabiya]ATW27082.1 magnesium and cobalt transport protein CorA [Candidatus Formimonas warabiya]